MEIKMCPSKHYYDAEKFSVCPYCADKGTEKTEGRNIYEGLRPNASRKLEISRLGKRVEYKDSVKEDAETEAIWAPTPLAVVGTMDIRKCPNGHYYDMEKDKSCPVCTEGRQNVISVSGRDGLNKDEDKTQGIWSVQAVRPVAGWLVCTEGSVRGISFQLYAGRNYIGRAPSMDVCLEKDKSVSRERHAVVIYEPFKREFYVSPGDSHELFYLNGSVVLEHMELADRDELKIGETILRFVAFCDKEFGW